MAIEDKMYGAGLQEVFVKLADASEFQGKGAVDASGDPENDVVNVDGDDQKLARFVFGQSESVSVVLNSVSFEFLEALTGNTVASSATGMEIELGTDSEQNPPFSELRAKSLAKNSDGTSGYFQKTWYKFQITSVKVTQASGSELSCELEGTAYKTSADIEGNALTNDAIAKIEHWTA